MGGDIGGKFLIILEGKRVEDLVFLGEMLGLIFLLCCKITLYVHLLHSS